MTDVGTVRRQAILIAHGIGQQQPFQVLDSFSTGFSRELCAEHEEPTLTHHKLGRNTVFDHYISVESKSRRLDVYELCWAPLTQGQAGFLDVIRWIAATALTPVQRFAFNIPLITKRASKRYPTGSGAGYRLAVAREFLRELRRVTFVPLLLLAIAAGALVLVGASGNAGRLIVTTLQESSAWALLGLVIIAATFGVASALIISLTAQLRDLHRLTRRRGGRTGAEGEAKFRGDRGIPYEVSARQLLLFFSVAMVAVLAIAILAEIWIAGALVLPALAMFGGVAIVVLAWGVKRVLVDYVADIALYATADENSLFYKTRSAILLEATRKLRWLLRQPYDDVILAGHSLGSVIAYDALSWLRTEQRVTRSYAAELGTVLKQLGAGLQAKLPTTSQRELDAVLQPLVAYLVAQAQFTLRRETQDLLARLVQFISLVPSEAAMAARSCIDELDQLLERAGQAAAAPLAPGDFSKLRTLVTFGSPLNKFVYFFRAKVSPYEVVRAHILHDLHGFRRSPDLSDSDLEIREDDAKLEEPADAIRWLNIWSRLDPVSGDLAYFEGVKSVEMHYPLWGACHTQYWHDPRFYCLVKEVIDAVAAAPRDEGIGATVAVAS
jgi:hypothetical protein